jgi:DNA replication and repair protein RecF
MPFIHSLHLHNFRCYDAAAMEDIHSGLIVLYGPNGAGKTNVLEAVSLLSPGRGLRGAANEEMARKSKAPSPLPPPLERGEEEKVKPLPPFQEGKEGMMGGDNAWTISSEIREGNTTVQIGTGLDAAIGKRLIRINGVPAKSQNAMTDYISCVWLTPQMDRLFLDSAGSRRKFFDRLLFAFDPGHAGRINRYENAMTQRSKLLREGKGDPAWLKSLESQMAETGIAIAAARTDFLTKMQRACDLAHEREETFFPKAKLSLSGLAEEQLSQKPAVEVEEMLAQKLLHSRSRDAETGGAAAGPHKTDFLVRYAAKDMPADQCSTGEQKALLIGISLAHARLMKAERGHPPVFLLDEVAAHLDENRRAALFGLLAETGAQVWMTGTDESLFSAAKKTAQFWRVECGKIFEPRRHEATKI